jgi:hypothetical protein
MSWEWQGRQYHMWFGHGTAPGPVQQTQATTPNTAADAGQGSAPVATNIPGRYVADDPQQWLGHSSVGTGECVALVQAATGAPRTTEWRPGVQVQGNVNIRPGTAIATFDDDGHYTGHAAIYLGQDAHGIHVIDQWNVRQDGRVVRQQPPDNHTLSFMEPRRTLIN